MGDRDRSLVPVSPCNGRAGPCEAVDERDLGPVGRLNRDGSCILAVARAVACRNGSRLPAGRARTRLLHPSRALGAPAARSRRHLPRAVLRSHTRAFCLLDGVRLRHDRRLAPGAHNHGL